ncbi:UDP-2,4-diacetamido-2,4,6-trideoxy-beta-L-altropyranose hydrolase [Lysinibacillus endophyticus]|uniref:UDP-2,4-diacetamido-2,4, 6-trideoxy-beta-L-altropyranose hydrolase n=1 Tax=Ureibacillus endophyticus TaxID=1978490 RepID=UPI0020A14BCD|nr:UDP-2,4-diacetamido-2,4,6-trideoxy-beta-L-altropyranose hydrolase [Lysinibacillus endophyticus]MCP1143747.1 UDP-2,4-diacetamido-2,4,6-trideoxy-beta-L-altropyranose hydrolase [Lysinibacillus endophyticus]
MDIKGIFIRVDASVEIGTGHVMRCLTYAHEQKKNGSVVVFICRKAQGDCIELIEQNGFEVHELPSVNTSLWQYTKENWIIDANQTIKILEQFEVKRVVIDHYSIDEKWEKMITPFTNEIMVIDDLANRKHYCDILLDQNFYLDMNTRYDGLVSSDTKLLLGPKYALLREEFKNARQKIKPFSGQVERVFIFFGGSDPTNETEKVLRAIKSLIEIYQLKVDVVVGNSNSKKKVIKELCKSIHGVMFHCQVNNMAELMARADLAIGAGGAATWERAYLLLPSIVITVADNQIEIAEGLHKKNIIFYLGTSFKVTELMIRNSMQQFLSNQSLVTKISDNCLSLFK